MELKKALVYCIRFSASQQTPPPPSSIPLEPKGLDQQRKLYLFKEICQFCKEGTEDFIAPKP